MRSLVIREITILPAYLQVGSYEGFLDLQVLSPFRPEPSGRDLFECFRSVLDEPVQCCCVCREAA